jgi:predicted nucleic acid-binding protein
MNRAVTTVIDADGADLDQALTLIERTGAGGGLATDALIAALGMRHRGVVHTADADFARFPGVRWFNPITGGRG